jgi:hypothetical protein
VIPLTLGLLKLTRRYYSDLDRQLLSGARQRVDVREHASPVALIPVARWDRISQKAVAFALRLSPDVTALHCTDLEGPEAEEDASRIREEWRRYVEQPAIDAGLPAPRLLVVASPYRSVLAPLLHTIEDLRRTCPGRPIAVVLPYLVEARWWEVLMHTHRERRVRRALQRHAGPDVATLIVPWNLEPQDVQQVLAEEEPQTV